MEALWWLIHSGIAVGARSRTKAFIGILTGAAACIALLASPSQSPAQGTEILRLSGEDIIISYPAGWSVAPKTFTNMYMLINVPPNQQNTQEPTAAIMITGQTRRDHAEA